MNSKKIFSYVLIGVAIAWLLYRVTTGKTPISFDKHVIGIWIAAFLTLCVFSFMYKDNPFYKIAESVFIGVSAAYWMAIGFWSTIMQNCLPKLMPGVIGKILPGVSTETNYFYLISFVLGIMLLMRLSSKYGWISRWALAYIVGFAAGMNLIAKMSSDFASQIRASIVPVLIFDNGTFLWGATFSALVLITGLLAGLVYFFFSKEHKGAFGAVSKYGIWILMVTFGTSFAYTVMGRVALLIGRFQFLLLEWLKIGV